MHSLGMGTEEATPYHNVPGQQHELASHEWFHHAPDKHPPCLENWRTRATVGAHVPVAYYLW